MNNLKSIIIGFLIATCAFLLIASDKACGCEYGGPGTTRWNPIYVRVVE